MCAPGSTAACYSGPAGTAGVGICMAGTQTCNATGSAYGACVGDVTPAAEVCDALDNDCDGAVDENLGTTTCGVGACGETVDNCVGGVSQTCDPTATDGTLCDDGNACTATDACQGGICTGSDPAPDGTTCDDGGATTIVDTCTGGTCAGCVGAVTSPRFVDNGDGTGTDRQTCLVWEKKTGTVGTFVSCSTPMTCPAPHDVNNRYQWSSTGTAMNGGAFTDFLVNLNGAGFAGHTDWRLPTSAGSSGSPTGQPAELESIVDTSATGCGSGSPCINAIFGSTVASFYWSSSTDGGSVLIWGVDFNDGGVASDGLDDRGYSFVRAVRGGP